MIRSASLIHSGASSEIPSRVNSIKNCIFFYNLLKDNVTIHLISVCKAGSACLFCVTNRQYMNNGSLGQTILSFWYSGALDAVHICSIFWSLVCCCFCPVFRWDLSNRRSGYFTQLSMTWLPVSVIQIRAVFKKEKI